jgi:hypothetical protein
MSISLATSLLTLSPDTHFMKGISEIYTYYRIFFFIISDTKIYGTSVLNIQHDLLFSTSFVWYIFLLQQVLVLIYSGDTRASLHAKWMLKLSNSNKN